MKRGAIQANLRLPKLEKRIVWAGVYGGHYDQMPIYQSRHISKLRNCIKYKSNGFGTNTAKWNQLPFVMNGK
jgi:hypothetical protein